MNDYIEMITSLTLDYLNVYVIEPEKDTGMVIKLDGYITDGIKEKQSNFTYSKMLTTYANNRVYKDDRENFLKTVLPANLIKSFSNGQAKLEINYRVIKDDKIEHCNGLYTRISKVGEPLKIVVGFRNVENIISIQKENRKEGLLSAYNALSDVYLSMHRVNVKNNTYSTIKTTDAILKYTIPNSNRFDENVKSIIKGLAKEEYYLSAIKFLDINTLDRRLHNKKHISINFEGRIAGLCKLHFMKEDEDEFGNLFHVIFAVEVIEDSKYQSAFDALSSNYKNVYLLDLNKGTANVLKFIDEFKDSRLDELLDQEFPYETILNAWISDMIHPDDKDMLKKALSVDNLKEVFSKGDEFTGNYRMLIDGKVYNYQFNLKKINGNGKVIAGFQNIDKIIAEHEEIERKEREMELAHQRELEEQLAIFNSLSYNFKNVFIANLDRKSAKVLKLADDIAIFNTIDKKNFHYDDVIEYWLNNKVHKEDRDRIHSILNSNYIEEFLKGHDECVGNYRSLDNDNQYHNYQFTVRKLDDKNNVIVGFQVIDSIIEEHLAREKKEREKDEAYQRELKKHNEVIGALSTIYSTIFKADVDSHEYEVLTSVPMMNNTIKTIGNIDDAKDDVINSFIGEKYKEHMREFLNFDTLKERLKNINTIVDEYKSPWNRWIQARFIVKSRDEKGDVKEVLYVARDFTDEKCKELMQQERLEALSKDYTAVFSCDLLKDTMNAMKMKETSHFYKDKEHTTSFSDWINYSYDNIIIKDSVLDYKETFNKDYLINYFKDNEMFISRHKVKPNKANHEYFEVRVVPYYQDENSYEVMWAFRSIDEIIEKEKKQQEQLSLALAGAKQANRAKSTFLNSMSHDIRTPMNAIIGFTALAQTHIDNTTQVQDYLKKISTSSSHLLSLINDILDMSRIESGAVKLDERPVHIPDVLHDLRTMIQGLVNAKNQNLYIDALDVEHEDVITDKLRLNQVLINIVGNAIKFTKPGGDIIIRLAEKPCSIKGYTTYEFSVKDNGIGMSKEFIDHIFDTFSREYSSTVSGVQGSGLGMAITKNIVVDMMGGNIEVESEVGKGSKFTVTLNLKLTDEPIKFTPIEDLLGARVLVVDDDINTCRSVCKMLREIKMRPDWTSSGREAIIRAQDASDLKDEYKVFIIDYLMPDINGIETIRRIRKVISEEVPIIILTAYDWTDFETEARQAGVTAFVSKPLFMSELRNALTSSELNVPIKAEKKHYDYSGRRVLLVEDNELNREIACAILSETGLVVDSVEDGDIAVATINKEAADKYDLILMDIQMPRMDGYTATREIRTLPDNKKANIPIVAMTANAFEDDKKKSLEVGMNGHIVKPISIDEIAIELDKVFGIKR